MVPVIATSLPVEVWERVIDFCAEYSYIARDARILRSCALTCRSWAPRSHYHLFYYITIKSESSLLRLASIIRTSPTRAEYVRYLQAGSTFNVDQPLAHRYPALLPIKLAFRLHNLKGIHLQSYPPDSHDVSKLSAFKSVTQLTLTGCIFTTFNDFVKLVQAFGNLCDLRIRTTGDTKKLSSFNPEILRTPVAKQLKIKALTVHVSLISKAFFTNLVSWILTTPTITTLDKLSIQALISGLGGSLSQLGVENSRFRLITQKDSPSTSKDKNSSSTQYDLHPISSLISSIPAKNQLREIILELKVQTYRQFDGLTWESFDQATSLPHLKGVDRMTIFIDTRNTSDFMDVDVLEELKKKLPLCSRRGILRPYSSTMYINWLGERQRVYKYL
ncbi:hypothetical protein QCA50_004805 [Cerrena zonata]|uniref:F-box domain-containing protein n=1 Tax=Cerrena zonata TaxID=2478898 RepID=A0AAW0GF54_9APHY